nr:reverse transcriptase domain-containing protein [Tanacetum cinerariifolium]
MSDSKDSTITYTAVSSPFEGLSDIRSPGVDGPPLMPEDPYAYVVAAFQALPSPDYVLGPEYPPSPKFVPEPVYSEFMPEKDDILLAKEQPLPAAALPVTESDPEDDPKEDPVDYPADGGDEGDDKDESSDDDIDLEWDEEEDESSDDDKDDDIDIEGDEEEDEYLARADSTAVALPVVDHAPFAEETDLFETDESTATPPPHPTYRIIARILRWRAEREEFPEVDLPLRKRLCTAHTGTYELGKSSAAAAARLREPVRDDLYRFGTPRAIITDRDTHFCSDQFAKVMLKYGVTHRRATPYHPQTSRQVEVSNHGLKRILERTVGENRAFWPDKLDDALWAFRSRRQSTKTVLKSRQSDYSRDTAGGDQRVTGSRPQATSTVHTGTDCTEVMSESADCSSRTYSDLKGRQSPSTARDTWDDLVGAIQETAPTTVEGVNRRVTELSTTFDRETSMIYAMIEEKRDDQALQRARVNRLFRDRRYHAHTARLIEGEARASRTAWTQLMDTSDAAHYGVIALRTQVSA